MDPIMKKILLALLFSVLASTASAQTATTYYTVPTIATLKALTTSRPPVVQVTGDNAGVFNMTSGACTAADDIFQVQPSSGTTVCYTRMASLYNAGKGVGISPLSFGAVCDGTTDDFTALNLWMASLLSTGKEGVLPAGSCTFSTPLTAIARNGITITGQGQGVSELKYIGSSTTPGNLITFGDPATQYQYLNLSGFSVGSKNALTTGAAIRVRNMVVVNIDVDFNGKVGVQGNLFNGLYLDSATNTTLNNSRFYTAGTAVLAHTGVELHMGSAFLLATQNTTSVGVHIGGGFGGWYGEQMGQILAHIGILVDNGLTNQAGTGNTHTSTLIDNLNFDTSTLSTGWFVTGTNIPNGAYITGIPSYNSITISAAATGTSSGGTVNVTRLASTANINSTTTISGLSLNTANLTANMGVSGTGIPVGAYITSIDSSSQIHISAAATATTTGVQLTFQPGNNQFFFGGAAFDSNKDAGAYFNDSVYNPVGKSIDMQVGWIASTSAGNGFVVVNWNSGSFNSAGGTYTNNSAHGLVFNDPTTKVRIGSAARISDNGGYGIYAASPITIYYPGLPYNNTSGPFSANVSAKTASIQTTDASALNWLNNQNGSFLFGVEGNRNGVISTVVNNLAPSTSSYPSSLTGIAYQKGAGNVAFSIYNENHINTTGTSTAETAAFQDAYPSPNTYPFDESLGTTQSLAKGWQIGAATTNVSFTANMNSTTGLTSVTGYVAPCRVGSIITGAGISRNTRASAVGAGTITLSKTATATASGVALTCFNAAAIGTEFVREGSSSGQFNFGLGYKAGSVLSYGIYMDATASLGSENGAYIAIPGDTGTNVILKTMGSAVTSNKMLDLQRADGTSMASITQAGGLTAATGLFTGTITTGGYTVASLPVAPGTGARAYVTNQLTTCAVTGAALTGGGTVTCPVFYNGTAWVGG